MKDFGICERLSESRRGRAKLNEAIHRRAEFACLSAAEFETPAMRLALLPTDDFLRVFHFAAAACLAPTIAKMVSKTTRAALHDQIGAEAWTFAVKRAALLTKRDSAAVSCNFAAVRSDLVESYFAPASTAFKQRLLLKTPPSWNMSFDQPRSDDQCSRAQSLVLQVCRLEFREVTEPLELWGNPA